MSYLDKLPKEVIKDYKELRPCQIKAIDAGLLEGKNLLICTPTASGKTLVAEIAAIKRIKKGKCVYIVPLKALALEKNNDFKKKYPNLKTAISIGDLDSSDPWLANSDIIITTSEKMESLIRHGAIWITKVATIIIDEVHLLNEPDRGPTLEILITLLKRILPKSQLIALSATIGNPEELAKWLEANLVIDDWRPIKLYQGVYLDNEIDFFNEKDNISLNQKTEPAVDLAIDTIIKNKQALVFCATKSSAEATAERIAKLQRIDYDLHKMSEDILKVLSSPTKQCRRLSYCIKHGIAFHHSGLPSKQRSVIENAFRDKKIKIICCTPTLAMGISMDAFRTIIKSLKRYSSRWGYMWIPVLEYHQCAGRAGRP